MGLTCEPVHNLVARRKIQEEGITFHGTRFPDDTEKEFISSTDVWSRPVRIETGPDGALWMADMYRYVIEHPQWIPDEWQKQLDLRAGYDKGRIYRIYKKENKPGPLPKLKGLSTEELIQKLATENGTIRDLTQKTLIELNEDSSVPELEKMIQSHESPKARLHALCTLNGMEKLKTEILVNASKDQDWRIQRIALRFAEKNIADNQEIQKAVLEQVENSPIQLQYQLAITLGECNTSEAGEALGKIAVKHFDDHWMRAAILSSSLEHSETILDQLLINPSDQSSWSDIVSHLIVTNLGKTDNKSIDTLLEKITGDPAKEVLPWQMHAMSSLLEALSRKDIKLASLKENAPDHLKNLILNSEKLFQAARARIINAELPISERVQSVALLGQGPSLIKEDLLILIELLSPQIPPELQNESVRTLGKISNDEIPALVLKNWRSYSSVLQGKLLTLLSQRNDWTLKLLDAIEAGNVLVVDFDAGSRARLLKSRTKEIRERAGKIFESTGSESRQNVIKEYEPILSRKGNFISGSLLFHKHCTACHKFRERGNEFGANLAVLSDKSTSNLLTSILDPNRAVEKKFFNYQIVTKNGKIYSGMSFASSSTSVTLVSPDGKKETILRTDIEEYLNTGKSFMPEGLEKDLNQENISDIIAFVQSHPIPLESIDLEMITTDEERTGNSWQ